MPAVTVGGTAGRFRTRVVHRLHEVSLSARLVAIVTSLLVVALVLTGVVTVALLNRVLVGQVDDQLTALVRNKDLFDAVTAPNEPQSTTPLPSDYIVQVNDARGRVLMVLPTLPNQGASPLQPVMPPRAQRLDRAPFSTTGRGGEPLRAIALPAKINVKTLTGDRVQVDGVVTVARSLDPVHRAVSAVAAWFFVVGIVVASAGALLGAAAVRRAFRPLRGVEAVATAYRDGDTSARVGDAPPTTEVGRMGLAVNAMLDRIETSLAEREASEERMRRFVADASHELRTPLAAVRGFAELYRMGALRARDDVTGAFSRVEQEATRMGVLVEDLLLLARLDEQRPLKHAPVDLLSLAVDARTDARALAPGRQVTVVGATSEERPSPAMAVGDEARLRQVVANLLANALRHTPDGSPVEVGAGVREDYAVLRVVDHGPGVDPADAQRVFERFYRADPSRARHQGGGSGLGLAIVAAIVAAHGGVVRLVATPGGGATAEVALPLARLEADDPFDPDTEDEAPAAALHDDPSWSRGGDHPEERPDDRPGDGRAADRALVDRAQRHARAVRARAGALVRSRGKQG